MKIDWKNILNENKKSLYKIKLKNVYEFFAGSLPLTLISAGKNDQVQIFSKHQNFRHFFLYYLNKL